MLHGKLNFHPGEEYQVGKRFWQGCPTIQRTLRGTLFAGWYSGGFGEPSLSNYNLLVRSRDGGLSWSDPLLVIESLREEATIAIDIQLWMDPLNRMWLFWTQRHLRIPAAEPGHLELWAMVCDDPDAETLHWSEPRFITPGFLRCRPTVLSDGRWLCCAYDWLGNRYHYSESRDNGNTWIRKEAGEKMPTDFDESMILERTDGSLWMLARCFAGVLAESISTDGGEHWSPGAPTRIPSPFSRFFLRRLQSGRVLLIKNDHPKSRIQMTALLSEDDGRSWKYSMVVDPRETSYPDAVEGPDGTIYMIHDRGRTTFREILCSRFTEEDIIAGHLVNFDSYVCQIISKAPAVPWDAADAKAAAEDDSKMRKAYFS